MDELAQQGRVLPDTVALYGRGRITLWTRADSPLSIEAITDADALTFRRWLVDGRR